MMMSHGLGGAVVDQRVLLRRRPLGGARVDRPIGAFLPGLEEAVGEDRQQRQDGHRQKNGQRDVP